MDLNDGQKSIEAQSKDQREHSFKEPPSLLEVRGRKEGKAGGEREGGGGRLEIRGKEEGKAGGEREGEGGKLEVRGKGKGESWR